jgi:hypothetical protein
MTTAVIANTGSGGYAHAKARRPRAVVMGEELEQVRADLERRVRAGEWLKTGPVSVLLGMGRTKIHMLVKSGVIGHRKIPGATVKPQRECNPKDVLRLLDERRREYHGDDPADPE